MSFQILGLNRAAFEPLFHLTDEELAQQSIRRMMVNEANSSPCRVSLVDAQPGEEVLLLPFVHLVVDSPYRSSGPIFVRQHAVHATLAVGEVPDQQRRRFLSVRAYDDDGWMIGADVTPGTELEAIVERFWAMEQVRYLQLHYARTGCFACQVNRV